MLSRAPHHHTPRRPWESFRLTSLPTRWHGFFARHPVLREIGRLLVALACVIVIGALILALAGE